MDRNPQAEQPSEKDLPKKKSTGKSSRITQLGDFRLGPRLGQGAMGTIYRSLQLSTGEEVAVKILRRPLSKNKIFVERFKREARLMAKLHHPNIVRCLTAGKQFGRHFFAMELVEGYSLREWRSRLTRLTVGDTLHILQVCARALQYAHDKGLIHRDIKPENILITNHGQVKIADLGLAKGFAVEELSMTQTGRGAGTPVYVAPEQARNARDADNRSDIHALGCTIYHLLTGELPFKGESSLEVVLHKIEGNYLPASEMNPEVSKKVDAMIARMLASHPDDRYQNCLEILEDVERLKLANSKLSFIEEIDPLSLEQEMTDTDARLRAMGTHHAPGETGEQSSTRFHVIFRGPDGKWVHGEMTLAQLEVSLQDSTFRSTVQVGMARGDYHSLESFPEIKAMLRRLDETGDGSKSSRTVFDQVASMKQAEKKSSRSRKLRNLLSVLLTTTEGWLLVALGTLALVGFGTVVYLITQLF